MAAQMVLRVWDGTEEVNYCPLYFVSWSGLHGLMRKCHYELEDDWGRTWPQTELTQELADWLLGILRQMIDEHELRESQNKYNGLTGLDSYEEYEQFITRHIGRMITLEY